MKAGREYTAYHEAGHAIIAEALGSNCAVVSIAPRGTALGHASAGPMIPSDRHLTPHRMAVYSYAGHAATVLLLGVGTMGERSATASGAGADFREAAGALRHDRARMQYAKRRAGSLVRHYRERIERLARLLEEWQTVDGQFVAVLADLGITMAQADEYISNFGGRIPREWAQNGHS